MQILPILRYPTPQKKTGAVVDNIWYPKITAYSWEDGPPSSRINDVAIDKDKTIWFATRSGLSHYVDGAFINYVPYETGLPKEDVTAIYIDDNGDKYIGMVKGVVKYDGVSWESIKNAPFDSHPINKMAKDKAGHLWVWYNPEGEYVNNALCYYTGSKWESVSDYYFRSFFCDNLKNIWLCDNSTLKRFDGAPPGKPILIQIIVHSVISIRTARETCFL